MKLSSDTQGPAYQALHRVGRETGVFLISTGNLSIFTSNSLTIQILASLPLWPGRKDVAMTTHLTLSMEDGSRVKWSSGPQALLLIAFRFHSEMQFT